RQLELAPYGVLDGIVRGPDGAPLEGAQVSSCADTRAREEKPATTDARGHFRLENVKVGETQVVVVPPGATAGVRLPATVAAEPRDAQTFDAPAVGELDVRLEGGPSDSRLWVSADVEERRGCREQGGWR